jgi:hypothetical protein
MARAAWSDCGCGCDHSRWPRAAADDHGLFSWQRPWCTATTQNSQDDETDTRAHKYRDGHRYMRRRRRNTVSSESVASTHRTARRSRSPQVSPSKAHVPEAIPQLLRDVWCDGVDDH